MSATSFKCPSVPQGNYEVIADITYNSTSHLAAFGGQVYCYYYNFSDYSLAQDIGSQGGGNSILAQQQQHGTGSGIRCNLNNTCIGDLKLIRHKDVWTPEVIQRVVTIAIIMFFTLIGNITIVVVLTFSKYRKLTSRVNIFIINLAIGDLTVLFFTMTTEIIFVAFEERWMLGPALCKIMLYIQIVTLASTTFILTAMSYDRYLALCKPLKASRVGGATHARRMIILAWVMAFVFATPQLLIFKQVEGGIYSDGDIKYKCSSKGYTAWWQRKLYFTFLTLYILIIPTAVISYCYINVVRVVWKQGSIISGKGGEISLRRTNNKSIPRAKVKTIKMTLSIICTFIMCWLPYFVVHLIHIWSEYRYYIPGSIYVFAETMALVSSALNPILYGCFNIKLKRGLLEVFCPQRLEDRYSYRVKTGVNEYVSMTEQQSGGGRLDNKRKIQNVMQNDCKSSSSRSSGGSHNITPYHTVPNKNSPHAEDKCDVDTDYEVMSCNGSYKMKPAIISN